MSSHTRSLAPSPALSLVHKRSLIGFRTACEELWGEAGCRAVAEDLPADVRERTAGLTPLPEWVPLNDLVAWHVAVWYGPAERNRAVMTRHAQLTVDHGFGRVKRFVLSLATPHILAPRVAAMWRDEYSSGSLSADVSASTCVVLTLRDHEYIEHPLMRGIISEAFRHIVSMTKVRDVTEAHSVRDRALIVVLRWS